MMSGLKNRDFEYDCNSDRLFEAVLSLKSIEECEKFFRDVMTISEIQAVTERFTVALPTVSRRKTLSGNQ